MEFWLIFIVFPIIVMITSIIGYFVTKKAYVTPSIIFVLFSFLMLLLFNETFFIWVVLYTLLSVIVTIILFVFRKLTGKKNEM